MPEPIEPDSPTAPAAPPAPPERHYLSVTGIADTVADLGAAYAILAEKSTTILAQPEVTMHLIQTLPEDLALLRRHVSDFTTRPTLAGGILDAIEAIATTSEAVADLASGLLPTARLLDAAGSGANADGYRAVLRGSLHVLLVRTTALNPDSHSAALPLVRVEAALDDFASHSIGDDLTRFEAAADAVQSGDVIHQLELQITALQGQIDDLNAEVAEGATSQIGNAIAFGFAIAGSVASAETDPGGAVLGVGFAIKDEVEKGVAFAKEMAEKNRKINEFIGQYRDLLIGLATERQEMALLLTIGGHGRSFSSALKRAESGTTALLGQLQLLAHGISSLGLFDDMSSDPTFYTRQFQAAIDDWTAVGQNCAQQLQLARSLG